MRERTARRVALLAFLLLPAGCSDSRLATVTGTITVDGRPLEKGSISFFPADGKGPTAGSDVKDGKYTATKVAVGTVKVQIRYAKKVGEKPLYDTPNSPVRPLFKEALPAKFNDKTELTLEVKPGTNEKQWDLSTK
jgi:hypothetical protein